MANPHKGEVELVAGDKTFLLRFSIDDICAVEEKSGKGFVALTSAMSDPDRMTISGIRLLLWGALRTHHADVTLLQAGNLITSAGGLAKVVPILAIALERAFPQESGADDNQRPQGPGQVSTGPAS